MRVGLINFFVLVLLSNFSATKLKAQNGDFLVSISLGVGNSGFKIMNVNEDKVKWIYYPTGGLQIQKRLSPKWAINFYPNVWASGNQRVFKTPSLNLTSVKSLSSFISLGIHGKYFLNKSIYCSLGPELSYLIRNHGSTYNGEYRMTNKNETQYFNRLNFLLSSSIGISQKIEESRKNAPIQINVLWYIEFRLRKGISNILNEEYFGKDSYSSALAFEVVTGFSFASKR
jgi:hypothetical protein